jgi:hypothetical protein
MGQLALWGAIGGAAKGAEKHLLNRAADESYEKRAGIDEAREKRMAQLQQDFRIDITDREQAGAMERQGAADEAAMARLEKTGEQAESLEGVRQSGRERLEDQRAFNQEQLQVIEQNWQSVEKERDRISNMNVAERRAAIATSSNPALLKALIGRYEKTQLTEQEMNEYGIPMSQRDLPLTYDRMDGKYYAQEGDKLFLANSEKPDLSKYEKPTDPYLEKLAEDPVRYEGQFLQSFGYLPNWFLAAKMNAGLQGVSGPVSE